MFGSICSKVVFPFPCHCHLNGFKPLLFSWEKVEITAVPVVYRSCQGGPHGSAWTPVQLTSMILLFMSFSSIFMWFQLELYKAPFQSSKSSHAMFHNFLIISNIQCLHDFWLWIFAQNCVWTLCHCWTSHMSRSQSYPSIACQGLDSSCVYCYARHWGKQLGLCKALGQSLDCRASWQYPAWIYSILLIPSQMGIWGCAICFLTCDNSGGTGLWSQSASIACFPIGKLVRYVLKTSVYSAVIKSYCSN